MPNWAKSMQQTFEYYTVDPVSWENKSKLNNVIKSTISWDADADTLGSATFDIVGTIREVYVRIYLVTVQNGITEKFPLGTFLIQTPRSKYDGRIRSVSADAYTPLLELKENPPPIGYYIPKKQNVMDMAYKLMSEHMRAPIVEVENSKPLYANFVANSNDTWLSYIKDLIANANYELGLDEMGRVLYMPIKETATMRPVCEYNDGNSSILYPEVNMEHDIYGIPNVVEVSYSRGGSVYYARAVNKDSNSPTSTVNRGREITYRVTDPEISGEPTKAQIAEYAKLLLKEKSTVEYTVTYSHGYRPVRIGNCVRLNYDRAGLTDVKAKVVSQTISCEPGCKVTETAVITTKLWG